MFQDDRMISVLSAVVLMVAIGTVIQRADFLSGYFGEEHAVVLNTDVVEARVNRLLRIDVFQNDEGITDEERDRLALVGEPTCGRVFVQGQTLQYLPDASCSGEQILQYGIKGRDDVVGQVIAQMAGTQPSPDPEPQAEQQIAAKSPQKPAVAEKPTVSETPLRTEKAIVPENDATTEALSAQSVPEPSMPSVVEQLIAGTAQPAEAAVPRVDAQEEDRVAVQQPQAQAEPALIEPKPSRALTAELGIPAAVAGVSDVSSVEVAVQVKRGPSGPKPSQVANPQVTDFEKPIVQIATPSLDVRVPDAQRTVPDQDQFDLAAIDANDQAPIRTAPVNGGGDIDAEEDSGFLIAVVSRKEPTTEAPKGLKVTPAREVALKNLPTAGLSNSRADGSLLATIQPLQRIIEPSDDLSVALPSSPVDASQPPPGAPANVISSTPPPSKPVVAAAADATDPLRNSSSAALSGDRNAPPSPEEPQSDQLAALPRHDAPCVIPPAMTIDVRRAARSIVGIDAPCHAETVAELQYSGLRLAVPLDRKGHGSLAVLGFEPNAAALLTFVNGEVIDFDLPFKEIGRVSRVALVWDMPVSLELNAIEFGAETGSEYHVRPENPRSFKDVRRSGGGFLQSYRSYFGIGQNAQIYTYYHRRGGQQGVVELMIDYASRNRDLLDGTCGDGKYAAPNFLILRSEDARLERPIIRKLAALDCSSVTQEKGDKRLISSAVEDLLVVQR